MNVMISWWRIRTECRIYRRYVCLQTTAPSIGYQDRGATGASKFHGRTLITAGSWNAWNIKTWLEAGGAWHVIYAWNLIVYGEMRFKSVGKAKENTAYLSGKFEWHAEGVGFKVHWDLIKVGKKTRKDLGENVMRNPRGSSGSYNLAPPTTLFWTNAPHE